MTAELTVFAPPVILSAVHRQYLLDHAITGPVIEAAGIHSAGDDIVFPWADGDQVTEQRRTWPGEAGQYRWTYQEPLHFWVHRDPGPDAPVLLVEGTKQSLAAHSWAPAEYAVYGMVGCAGAARLKLTRLGGRKVVVVVDADAATNLNVYAAAEKLGTRLTRRGATVSFVDLAAGGTTGLDDVLAREFDEDERTEAIATFVEHAIGKPANRRPTKSGGTKEPGPSGPPDTGGRPLVMVNADRGQVIDSITRSMVERAGGVSLFSYGGVITRVDGHVTTPLLKGDFNKTLTEHVACFHHKAPTATAPAVFDPAWPDSQTVDAVMSNTNARTFPELRRVVRAPFVRPDGSVCTTPGYDRETRSVLAPGDLEVLEVSESPSPQGVRAAVSFLLEEWLGDFPFATEADRANVLAAVITPFIRGMVPLVPLCVVTGTGPGVGKGLLAECISTLVTGEALVPRQWPGEEEEVRKQLTATFRTGADLFVFDEAHEIRGASLARALTGVTWTDRLLGASLMVEYPNQVTWMALGNNVQVQGDLYRRVYFVALEGSEDTHDREASAFRHADLKQWTADNRSLLLAAALTVVRGWISEGSPQYSRGATMGSFEAWDRMLSGICAYAGHPGFLTDVKERRGESDFHGSYWSGHLEWLHEHFGSAEFTAAQVAQAGVAMSTPGGTGGIYEAPPGLDDPGEKGHAKKLGQAYAKVKDRWFGPYRLVKAGLGHRSTVRWGVQSNIQPSPSEGLEGSGGIEFHPRVCGKTSPGDVTHDDAHIHAHREGLSQISPDPSNPSIDPTNPFA